MPIFEINLPKTISKALGIPQKSPKRAQLRVLKKLLRRARYTAFGQKNKFEQIDKITLNMINLLDHIRSIF